MEYIQNNKKEPGCIFCTAIDGPDGPDNLIIYRGRRAYIILNRYPYTSGHLMAVPYAHVPSLEALAPEDRSELMELATRTLEVLREVYHPEGFNVGINIGAAAGAGIVEHVHMHVVPRWGGDTNFMTSLAGTRVLPETLEDTYQRVKAEWEKQRKRG
jgi:ATP adenylyltransferase